MDREATSRWRYCRSSELGREVLKAELRRLEAIVRHAERLGEFHAKTQRAQRAQS